MNIKYLRSYKKSDGKGGVRTVFVYEVNGNEAAIAEYKKSQGDHYVQDDDTGKSLFFTIDFAGDNGSLIITSKGEAIVDTEEYDKAASQVAQAGGNLGEEIAKIAAQRLMGGAPAPVAEAAPVARTTETPESSLEA